MGYEHSQPQHLPSGEAQELPPELAQAMHKIESATANLRFLTLRIGTLALMNLAFLVLAVVLRVFPATHGWSILSLVVAIFISLFALRFLLMWDRQRVAGSVLFEEIGDAISWHHRTYRPYKPFADETNGNKNGAYLSTMPVRLALQEYYESARLPLASSSTNSVFRYSVFFVSNIVLLTILIFLLTQSGPPLMSP